MTSRGAEMPPGARSVHSSNSGAEADKVVEGQKWDPELIQTLVWDVLGFSLIALVLMSLLLYRHEAAGQSILRCFGLVLIISFSAILLITGYSNEQLTPIVGLFGAIAGYLLGKDSNRQESATAPRPQAEPAPARAREGIGL